MKLSISGFIVVGPVFDGYRGIDREPWANLHREYYAGHLETELSVIRKSIYENGLDFSGFELATEIHVARKVLNWMLALGCEGEIIAVSSQKLQARKGAFESEVDDFLGWDVFSFGDWSLIRAAIIDSNVMSHWSQRLNEHRLFSNESDIDSFIEEYGAHVKEGKLEQLTGGPDFPIEPVKVARCG